MVHTVVVTLFLVMLCSSQTGAARILIASAQTPSHLNEHHAIGKALVRRGHQVSTILESYFTQQFKDSIREKNITVLEYQVEEYQSWSRPELDAFYTEMGLNPDFGRMFNSIALEMPRTCEFMMNDTILNKKIREMKFDFALVDCFYMNPCPALVAYFYGLPFACTTTFVEAMVVGTPSIPSFSPALFTKYSNKMDFWERLDNMYRGFKTFWFDIPCRVGPNNGRLLKKYGQSKFQRLTEVQKLAVIHFQTRDYLMEFPEVSMPNVVILPGVTAEPAKPLPQQMEDVMSKSGRHGVVVVSFSSFASMIPVEILQKMFDAFDKIPQQVFMRYSGDIEKIEDRIPKNVHLMKWLPLNDLLGHQKTKVFVTHTGNNARYEAMYHGVPMIGIPLFSEQHANAKNLAIRKLGKQLDMKTFKPSELRFYIELLINDPIYKKNIEKLSAIMKDRPMTASDTAVYWIEHVMKFGGDHLRSHAYDMPWYQFVMLDLLVFVLVVEFMVIVSLFAVCKFVVCKRKKPSKEKIN